MLRSNRVPSGISDPFTDTTTFTANPLVVAPGINNHCKSAAISATDIGTGLVSNLPALFPAAAAGFCPARPGGVSIYNTGHFRADYAPSVDTGGQNAGKYRTKRR